MRVLEAENGLRADDVVQVLRPAVDWETGELLRYPNTQYVQVVTLQDQFTRTNVAIENLFPEDNNYEHHLGFRESVQKAHRDLLDYAMPGRFLFAKKSLDTRADETAAASSVKHYHLAILDRDGEEDVIRGYEVSYENGVYAENTSPEHLSNADFEVVHLSLYLNSISDLYMYVLV